MALKCNPLLWVSPWILCSYQLLQDEKLSIQQPQRKKNSPSPHFSCQRASFHTEPTLVRQQLKPRSSGGGMGACEPQIYKLDFYPFTSCSLLSTHQLRRRQLCGLHVHCDYDHFHQRCITHDREELSGDTYDPVTNG